MSRNARSLLASAALLAAGATVLSGCGVSPAYTPVRTAAIAEPMPVEAAAAAAQPVETVGYEDTDPAALTDFHETLSPYGTWEEDATYGTVWVPAAERVGSDFAPYKTAGHWQLDQNDDWLWISDYDDTFGWVVFHYGRWTHTEARGWVWIPGRRYAPAWVAWQAGDPGYGYVGWAAMPPAFYWQSGAVVWLSVYPAPYYVYCPTTYVFHRDWHSYAVSRHNVVAVATPMRPYGTPQGSGRVYAQPHHGPSSRSGVVPPGSYPSTRHAMADGHRRYAVPSSAVGAGTAPGGLPRAGSGRRPQGYDLPGDAARPMDRSPGAFGSGGPSQSPPVARVPIDGPSRLAPAGPARAAAAGARPSSPTVGGPVQVPPRASAFSSPSRAAPPAPPASAAARAPSSFSAPSRSPSPSSFSAPSRSPSPSSFSAPSRASSPAASSPARSSSSSGSRATAPSGGGRGRR